MEKIIGRISLKFQIGIIVAMATVVFVIVGGIYSWGAGMQSVAIKRAAQAQSIQDAAETAMFFLLDAQVQEKEFLTDRSGTADDFLAQQKEDVKAALAQVDKIMPLLTRDEDRARIKSVRDGIEQYRAQFAQVATVSQQVGLTETEGLMGALRTSVHNVEDILSKHNQDHLTVLMLMMRRHEKDFLARREAKYVDQFQQRIQEFDKALAGASLDADSKRVVSDAMQKYQQDFLTAAQGITKTSDEVRVLKAANIRMTQQLQALHNQTGQAVTLAREDRDHAESLVGNVIALSLLLGGVTVVVAGWIIGRAIYMPLIQITHTMRRLADGDLAVDVPSRNRSDEVGQMAAAVEVFRQNALETDRLRHQQQEAEQRAAAERRQIMLSMADSLEHRVRRVVETINHSVKDLNVASTNLSANAEQTQRQSSAVAAATEQASANVDTVSAASTELTASIDEISRQVTDAAMVASTATGEAKAATGKISGLESAAQKIGEVIGLINDIAGQTNLLALNATIESARAGDAGKGFAVVANEVKHLAGQTGRATDDIARQVSAIQDETREAVSAIESIANTIERINEMSSSIASAVEQQGAATGEIARNVIQASQGTREVASNISGVAHAAGDTGRMAQTVSSAAETLVQEISDLERQIEEFLNELRAA